MSEEIFQLWSNLESSRILANEMLVNPWDSQSSQVQAIWADLTDHKRLDELLVWEESNSPLNQVAQHMVTQAINQARSNGQG